VKIFKIIDDIGFFAGFFVSMVILSIFMGWVAIHYRWGWPYPDLCGLFATAAFVATLLRVIPKLEKHEQMTSGMNGRKR